MKLKRSIGNDSMRLRKYELGEKLRRWMNVYPRLGEPDGRILSGVLFESRALADAFAIPGILACVG